MARRRRRRFMRISPDMGWWVDQGMLDFIYTEPNGSQAVGTADSIIQFDDITDDDSLILRDNSDWFFKRVLLEAYPNVAIADPANAAAVSRLFTLSIGTIDNDKLAEWVVNQGHTLFEPNGYEMWARMLRTYNKPVYQEWTPKIVTGSAFTGALAANTASTENYVWRMSSPYSGFSVIEDDFKVSNAGLKPEQSLSIAVSSLSPGGSGASFRNWQSGDQLQVRWALRVLLQKRRAA